MVFRQGVFSIIPVVISISVLVTLSFMIFPQENFETDYRKSFIKLTVVTPPIRLHFSQLFLFFHDFIVL